MGDYHVTVTPEAAAAARRRSGSDIDWEALDQQLIPTTPVVLAAFALEFAAVFGMAASLLVAAPTPTRGLFVRRPDYRLRMIGFTCTAISVIAYVLAGSAASALLHRGAGRRARLAKASTVLSHFISPQKMRARLEARTPRGQLDGDTSRHQPLVLAAVAVVGLELILLATGVVSVAILAGVVPISLLAFMVRHEMRAAARTSGAERRVHLRSVFITTKALRDTLMFGAAHLLVVLVLPGLLDSVG